jgi:uracil-DNA glycosylase family protein
MTPEERPGAERWVPRGADLGELRSAVQSCRGCELWRSATQAVFGDGSPSARMMLVGEQPGDREDLSGEPFVGPAGALLDRALNAAGIARDEIYVTNAVKHFRFEERGKRRIHSKPGVAHIVACAPWLDAELDAVDPALIVCLGATAARAVFDRTVAVGNERGRLQQARGRQAMVTVHPSSILRVRVDADRSAAFDALVADLRVGADALGLSRR